MASLQKLPPYILKYICEHLSLNSVFLLSITSQSFRDKIDQLSLDQTYELENNNLNLNTSFLSRKIKNIKVLLSPIRYQKLQEVLLNFPNLKSLDLSSLTLTYIKIHKLLKITIELNYAIELIVPENSHSFFIRKVNQLTNSQISIKNITTDRKRKSIISSESSLRKRMKGTNNDDEEKEEESRSNWSTPDFIIEAEEKLRSLKERIKEEKRSRNKLLKLIMKKFEKEDPGYDICLNFNINNNINNKRDVERLVEAVGRRFVEGVFISKEDVFILITQVEVYYKNKVFDGCSNSFTSSKPACKNIELVVEQKGDKNRWIELKVFYGLCEVLITGGIYGHIEQDVLKYSGFLGSSAPTVLLSQIDWLMYIPNNTVSINTDTRLLRNYKKRDSMLQWSFKSKHFVDLNFSTTSPFQLPNNVEVFYQIASYLIKASSEGVINNTHLSHCHEELLKYNYWELLGYEEEEAVDINSAKMGKTKKWLITCVLEKKAKELYTGSIELYTLFLYQKLRNINKKKIKEFEKNF